MLRVLYHPQLYKEGARTNQTCEEFRQELRRYRFVARKSVPSTDMPQY